ncbi:MAG TPA: HAD family hydrolase [Candidatus Lachnoclostridium stercorigallinarum]|uniref:HAD family hydrolase n=1 Tax=Candidatus Lachnoclostridium stercorigallinarum TaxID=2838634 RepID=A0A9D2GGS5_9FIRM|nr:HAD family hydrolase [Candidatus Lachnoclostridium stercorigallinarum]
MKKYLLFDLDGTLTDPEEGITKAVQLALRHFGIEVEDRTKLRPFIGPPLWDQFQEYAGLSREQAEEAVKVFRAYYTEKGVYENKEYPGIREMLGALKCAGYQLYVATSKPETTAGIVMKYFGFADYFVYVAGADSEGERVRKADVIRYLLEKEGITDLSEAVMIGDRKHDVLGAKEVGMDSIGVLYGYGSREELETAGAGYIAATVEELEDYLLAQVD